MQPLIQNNLDITMIQKKKLDGWQGKSIMDMKMHSLFLVGRKAAVVKKNVQNSNH